VVTVVVDGENVRRSVWPNLPERRLVELVRAWADREGVKALIVFDGRTPVDAEDVVDTGAETADDWIAREAKSYAPYWLVTSDRELRERAGAEAEKVLGGGSFAREIQR
jgi:hypothetical protein